MMRCKVIWLLCEGEVNQFDYWMVCDCCFTMVGGKTERFVSKGCL